MFAMFFKCFSGVSNVCFKYFIYLFFLYVASAATRCFKSRSDVAYEIRVGSGRGASGPCVGAGDAGAVE
jgi:hypothetical protein